MNRRKFGSSVGGKISKSSVRRVACALAKFQGTRTGGLTREREGKKKKKGGFSLKVETGSETEQIKRYQTKNRVQH